MTLCRHELEAAWCSIELHGVAYDPWGTNSLGPTVHDWPEPTPAYYPSDNGCPSQADYDLLYSSPEELLELPTATQFLDPVGPPEWYHEYEFGGTRFFGFYRNELTSIRGFGLDPTFAAIY